MILFFYINIVGARLLWPFWNFSILPLDFSNEMICSSSLHHRPIKEKYVQLIVSNQRHRQYLRAMRVGRQISNFTARQ